MRYIDLLVDNEHIKGSGVTIGAAGSHDAVALRLTFSEAWDGLTKRVLWIDARGTTRTETVLTTPLAETENVYAVPVPASPLQYPGKMSVTLYGVELDGGDEVLKIVTEAVYFPIMASFYDPESDPDGPLDIDPTIADQLQAEIDDILDDILDARAAAQDSEAWAVGQIDGVDVEDTDPRYHNNSKYYAEQADGSATSAGTSATTATDKATLSESWAVGGTSSRTGEDTNNSKYWCEQARAAAEFTITDDTPTTLTGVLFGNGANVDAKARNASGSVVATETVAPVSNSPAGSPLAGDQFFYGGKLYKSNGSGDPTEKTVGGELTEVQRVSRTVKVLVEQVVNDIGPKESGAASQAYATNEHFLKPGTAVDTGWGVEVRPPVLYKATAAITEGGTITPGTNCEQATIIDYLNMVAAADAIASAGVAPGGFGLGGIDGARIPKIATRAALDTATRNGWYVYGSTEDIATTVPYKYGAMLVIAYTQNRTMQMMYLYSGVLHNLTIVTRYQDGAGNWNAWEYLNPPTDVGNEYQTMERFLGNPVFCKALESKAITVNGTTQWAHGITNYQYLVRVDGFCKGTASNCYMLNTMPGITEINCGVTNLNIKTDSSLVSGLTGYPVIYYTKSS